MSGTTYSFQADMKELMIHSFYSSCDIFLRDLLSTSSDALEKKTHLFFQTEFAQCTILRFFFTDFVV